tara:strand:+ start:16860 stop:18095 length:1236 start_codon:yes stop_codon:yes gene_type:complete
MFKFREYQWRIIDKATDIVKKYRFIYLAMEVRTGKTLTSLGLAQSLDSKEVLFVTKKKAISSIESDYKLLNASFGLSVINYESIHKIDHKKNYDMLILDEAHTLGAFPKPSKRAKQVRELINKHNPYVCLMSGTPTPESYSQMFHQVYGIPTNPFKEYVSFYKFAQDYIDVRQRKINSLYVNDYSRGLTTILKKMSPMTISYSQKEAGFKNQINEIVLEVELEDSTSDLASTLKKHLVVEGTEEVILGDTPAKLMQKLHQLYSGTIKFESGNSMVLDYSKALYIAEKFSGKKIAIFYKFREEYNALKEVFKDTLCNSLEDFTTYNKNIALQIVSGREGISLRQADALVYYNIDFSATSYWQSRDRMTTKDRTHSKVYWVFSKGGIEKDIYKAVIKKKDYTVRHFKNDFLNL